ncbi:hypothetical protein U1Q18_018095 [Sarracenia purpurea var. burkii]
MSTLPAVVGTVLSYGAGSGFLCRSDFAGVVVRQRRRRSGRWFAGDWKGLGRETRPLWMARGSSAMAMA